MTSTAHGTKITFFASKRAGERVTAVGYQLNKASKINNQHVILIGM